MTNPARAVVELGQAMSPYPPSYGGNAWLYGAALCAVMSISVFGMIVAVWIGRDIWRDRMFDHPLTLVFLFRLMTMLVAMAAFIRSFPEVVYMTCYNDKDIPTGFLVAVLAWKRVMDTIALPVVASWMAIFVSIYPFVVIALRARPDITTKIDPLSDWPRLARPILIFVLVVAIAGLMAVAKGYGLER